jgi:hypothetical protein
MALKRAAAPAETTEVQTTAQTAVKETETVKEAVVETAKDSQVKEGELLEKENDQALANEGADKDAEADDAQVVEPEATATTAAAEPEAEIEPEQIKPQEVAVKTESGVALSNTERQAGAAKQFQEEMAAQGFEGLNLTGMSFDRMKLAEGQFQLGSEETNLGDSVDVQIFSTRSIYIVRQFPGNGAEMFYSYDPKGLTFTDGTSAEETLAEWRGDGYGVEGHPLEIKTYIEGMAQIKNRDDEFDDQMVSLSIPPASKDRLSGAFAVGIRKFGCTPGELLINCTVGKKIGTGEEAFRPWNFKAIGKVE